MNNAATFRIEEIHQYLNQCVVAGWMIQKESGAYAFTDAGVNVLADELQKPEHKTELYYTAFLPADNAFLLGTLAGILINLLKKEAAK